MMYRRLPVAGRASGYQGCAVLLCSNTAFAAPSACPGPSARPSGEGRWLPVAPRPADGARAVAKSRAEPGSAAELCPALLRGWRRQSGN